MIPELDTMWSQDLADYTETEQSTIQGLIDQDASVRAQYFAAPSDEQPAQVIGASGFSSGINMAVSPATGPI